MEFLWRQYFDCSFSNISGDGVDFSGSSAALRNSYFKDIADKAVSVGESSQVRIFNCKVEMSLRSSVQRYVRTEVMIRKSRMQKSPHSLLFKKRLPLDGIYHNIQFSSYQLPTISSDSRKQGCLMMSLSKAFPSIH